VILTLTALIVRNEFCEKVDKAGGIMFIMDVFVSYPASEVKYFFVELVFPSDGGQ
jgi:hypothetical protein